MKHVATTEGVKGPELLQTDGTIVAFAQACGLDDQTAPDGLLVGVDELVAIVRLDLLPVRRILLARRLDAVETVLALHEPNCDGNDPVDLVAIGTLEVRLGQFKDAKLLLADNAVVRRAGTVAFDIGSGRGNATSGSAP